MGFALAGLALAFFRPIPAGVWHDDGVFLIIGKSLAAGEGLRYAGVPGGPPAVKFPPLYPLGLGALWASLGELRAVTLSAVFLNLACLVAGGVLLARGLHRRAGLSPGVAATLAGLAFTSADVWRYALVPLSESLFVFFVMAALAAWEVRPRERRGRGDALLAAALVGAVLTRSAGVAVIAGFAAALLKTRGWRTSAALTAPGLAAALGWGAWAAHRSADIPPGSRDVLGPYGGWLLDQVATAPGSFVSALPSQVAAVFGRVFALALPGLDGVALWLAAVPVAAVAGVGARWMWRHYPPVVAVLAAYLLMLLLWPFSDRRLVMPVHPLVVATIGAGLLDLGRRWADPRARAAVAVLAVAWIGTVASVTAGRAASGWAVAGYQLRAGRMAAAVEVLSRTAEPGMVVGAPEFWAGLHLHGGWATVPSALFTPRSDDDDRPVWGSAAEQVSHWLDAGVDLLLLEQGGRIHGEALDLVERRCPGAVEIVARMPPQMVVRLSLDGPCREALASRSLP